MPVEDNIIQELLAQLDAHQLEILEEICRVYKSKLAKYDNPSTKMKNILAKEAVNEYREIARVNYRSKETKRMEILTFTVWLDLYKQISLQEFYDTSDAQQELLENEYHMYKENLEEKEV